MTLTGSPAVSLLDSVLDAQSTRVDIGVAVLKKAQDVTRQQGEAMVEMIEKSVQNPPSDFTGLDVYA
jgi:hypothetical protein